MNRLAFPPIKISSTIIVAIAYTLYVAVSAIYHDFAEVGIASLAVIPVLAGSWYFGIRGGIVLAILCILANVIVLIVTGRPADVSILSFSNTLRIFTLLLIAVVVGRLATVTSERSEALLRLEGLEMERKARVDFLEMLGEITRKTLEANDLDSSLKILLKGVAQLFETDDCYFAFWEPDSQLTIPVAAYGSMSAVYPYVKFEPEERTLTASALKTGRPLAIEDVDNSPLMSEKAASVFPNRSMLGLPLIAQDYRPAVIILGYNEQRKFDRFDLARAEIVSQHIALVLAKMQLLEDARKQIKQLTVLHKVSLLSTQAESEDQLIEQVTDIIGESLFLDNFGIMLLDERSETLRAHPSYRFFSDEALHMSDILLGVGVTGRVAKIGQPIRVGNVHAIKNYVDVDKRTVSELCVPIKLQEHVLGVINAESTKKGAFTVDDERLLVTLAGQLATTIERLRTAQAERHWLDQLAHSNELIYSLAHITTNIEKALTPNEIIRVLGAELNQIRLTCVVASYNADRKSFTIDHTSMEPKVLEQMEKDMGFPLIKHTIPLEKWDSVLGKEDLLNPMVISDPENEIQILFTRERREGISNILHGIGITPEIEPLRLPLMFEENLLGMFWIWGEDITRSDLAIMSIFGKQIGISLERARLFQEVQSLALTDPLTGLHNRRGLFELSRMEFSRAKRLNRPISCMMLDLDHFKQINDNYGHQIGDYVLQEFSQRCKNAVREIDLIGRYGGEELVIILPETDLPTALQIAERTRNAIAEIPIRVPDQEISVTVSIGVATKDENTEYLETLIARADQAMYIAKHKGRDRVAVSR
jgi:diguanylate cyclase (GGDEF)-like protein